MEAVDQSPNWYWRQLGADIERYGDSMLKRRISINGVLICDAVGHEEETRIARKLFEESK
jgi:hypothetical protein